MVVHQSKITKRQLTGTKAYLFCGLALAFGILIRFLLDPLWGDRLPYAVSFLGNLLVLQFVGVGPFIMTVLCGFALDNYFFVPPRHSLVGGDRVNQLNGLLYFLVHLVVLVFSQRARGARLKEEKAHERERQHLEELRESEARYSAVVQNSIDAILLTDAEERILAVNPAACRMFGRTKEELLGLSRLTLVDAAERERIQRAGNNPEKLQMEVTFVGKDDNKFTGEISTGRFIDRNGDLKCSSAIRDITERKRDEAQLASLHKELVSASH